MRISPLRRAFRTLALGLCLVCALCLLTACAKKDNPASSAQTVSLNVVVAAPYIDDAQLKTFADSLRAALPSLTSDGGKVEVTSISTGDATGDPMGTIAGITRLAAMMSAGEIDLLICDQATAERNARSESFMPLADIQTLPDVEGRETAFTKLDGEGNATDELLPKCGVILDDHAALHALVGPEVGAYVVVNAPHPGAAGEAIAALLQQVAK